MLCIDIRSKRGGPGGMPRPIEMHAHDPRRFVSDMLAWVHPGEPLLCSGIQHTASGL